MRATSRSCTRFGRRRSRVSTAAGRLPAVLRISYFKQGEESALIRQRLDVIEEMMRAEWARVGRGKLIVERTVKFVE